MPNQHQLDCVARKPDTKPDTRMVRFAMQSLTGVIGSSSRLPLKQRIDRFSARFGRAQRWADAAFAGIQTLRDFGTINRAEAAWLLHALFEGGTRSARRAPTAATASSEGALFRARGELWL